MRLRIRTQVLLGLVQGFLLYCMVFRYNSQSLSNGKILCKFQGRLLPPLFQQVLKVSLPQRLSTGTAIPDSSLKHPIHFSSCYPATQQHPRPKANPQENMCQGAQVLLLGQGCNTHCGVRNPRPDARLGGESEGLPVYPGSFLL